MISFESDYNNGAHEKVLQRLIDTNATRTITYGGDEFCESAREKIKLACQTPEANVFFLAGGTQTNATVIDSMLHTYEGVIAVSSAHINTHEAGAVEFTEHKIINIREHEYGKMAAEDLEKYLFDFMHDGNNAHCAYPGMVYITFPSEYGALYTAAELDSIYRICQHYHLPLYVDGARLGYALASPACDFDLPFLAHHCDVFYIGGTKVGALCGEAVVFTHNNAHPHFFSIQKQHGALLAKGRVLGVQFDALFTDNLYFDIAQNAITTAMQMRQIFLDKGYGLYVESPTNQQFPVMHNSEVERLEADILFTRWAQTDDEHTVCRFVTSWATTQQDIDTLRNIVG